MLQPRDSDAHDSPTVALNHSRPSAGLTGLRDGHPTQFTDTPGAYPVVPGYEILGVLGSGGMGVVYKARQQSLDRLVALKMIRPDGVTDPALLARFQAEAAAVARLNHPNIVQVYEVGRCADQPFLCLEFVAGTTLEHWIDSKPHDPHTTADLVAQMADGLHHAHAHGIIHRDMKPANVLLDENTRPRITDFGIARFLEGDSQCKTRKGELLGTPAYMAPEQADRGAIQTTTDVYALGVILYEMLTGRPPFVAPTGLETIQLVLNAEPVPPRKLQPNLPVDLETITLKCLRKEPHQRYASAQELADDLRRWLAGAPILARPLSIWSRAVRWCRRNPLTATLSAALVGTVVGLGTLGIFWRAANEERRIEEARRTERANARREAAAQSLDEDLEKIAAALRDEDWAPAREAQGHAEGILEHRDVPEGYRERLDESRKALDLVAALSRVLAGTGRARGNKFDYASTDAEYRACLEPLGIQLNRPMEEWVATLRQSLVRGEIVRAVDRWAGLRSLLQDARGCRWLLELNNQLDADEWRQEARRELLDGERARLEARSRRVENEARTRDQLRLLGLLLEITGQTEEAKRLYRTAQTRYPTDFHCNHALGVLLMNENTRDAWAEALGCFRAALAIRPASAGVQVNAGVMLWRLDRKVEALEAYRRAAALQPNYAAAHFNQGVVLQALQRHDEAADCFQTAANLEPDNPSPLYRVALMRLKRDRLADMRSILQLIEDRGLYRFDEMQAILMEMDRRGLDEASLEDRARALRQDPENAGLHYDQGTVLHRLGRFPEAVSLLREAVRLDPRQPTHHCNLGLALLEVGEFNEGVESLCRGHALASADPKWPFPSAAWLVDAQTLARLQGLLENRPLDELLRDLTPKEVESLGRLLAIQKRYAPALAAYARALSRGAGTQTAWAPAVRWSAARAGLLAGLGAGTDPVPESERQALRAAALSWLHQELADLRQFLAQGGPERSRIVVGHLDACAHSHDSRDLRRLISRLPAAEQKIWRETLQQLEQLRLQSRQQIEISGPRP
jgi:serine/threonine-protein kinase